VALAYRSGNPAALFPDRWMCGRYSETGIPVVVAEKSQADDKLRWLTP
jgi:hypothetical protein